MIQTILTMTINIALPAQTRSRRQGNNLQKMTLMLLRRLTL